MSSGSEQANYGRIIKKESVLFSNYSEDLFFKREEEERILSAIKPITEKKRCENLFVHGPTGSGKTPLIKAVLENMRNLTRSVICLYLNCWHYSTSMAIYVKIADALGEPVSRRGRAADEIFDRILERMRVENIGVLLALDDIDGLIYNNETKILHNLARVANNCARFGVVGISEDKNIINKLDSKILESLRFVEIEIKGYSKEQLLKILNERASIGLADGAYNPEILDKIANIGINNDGNGRLVLEILRRAAKKAEQGERNQITINDVETVSDGLNSKHIALSEEEQMIVNILSNGEKNTSEIYWFFSKKLNRSKRQIRNYLRSLEMKGIIESQFVKDKYNFGSKIINLRDRHG